MSIPSYPPPTFHWGGNVMPVSHPPMWAELKEYERLDDRVMVMLRGQSQYIDGYVFAVRDNGLVTMTSRHLPEDEDEPEDYTDWCFAIEDVLLVRCDPKVGSDDLLVDEKRPPLPRAEPKEPNVETFGAQADHAFASDMATTSMHVLGPRCVVCGVREGMHG